MFKTTTRIFAAVFVTTCTLTVSVPASRAEEYPADNSGKNVRDRDAGAVTAGSQSNTPSDLKITQQIRKAVVADKYLSTNAHNVKIITANGVVTLRGPVKSVKEKEKIAATAQRTPGVSRVDNQLEVASQR